MTTTQRGFAIFKFLDHNDHECSIQKSSAAAEDCIWLGCNEIGLQKFTPQRGWQDIATENDEGVSYIANNRMHLTQKQVAELLPLLQKFVETGELAD